MQAYKHLHTRAFLSVRLYSREEQGAWLSRTICPSSLSHLWEQGFLTHWGPPPSLYLLAQSRKILRQPWLVWNRLKLLRVRGSLGR